jgi:hypothetical protein
MKYARVFNDLHIYGPLQIMTESELFLAIVESPYPVILLGDIFDLKNCKKSEVGNVKDAILRFKAMPNVTFVGGNHELQYGNLPVNHVDGNGFFSHSHMLANPDKWGKWDYKEMECGAGFFKRHFISPLIDAARHLIEVRPNETLKANLDKLTKQNLDITRVFLAHSHPEEYVYFKINQALCQILTRGVHDVTY